ncbi:ArsR family transcriptional regulator [Catellatospora bangladeshensis]|uniref:Transcriptional regulator n=1 Tax=Catellatospora bangladeshensis TaxID=310355 RepID=A0A8J3NJV4_9ACTN|nr:ArsR family transcriptional regulator [Catellatospora bangladeshensis]GIF82393.1 transcriptional regulator [Catellatospora bangladeshensis]
MLRIHFTGADLAATRIAAEPDPLWELSLSMHQLRLRDSNPFLAGWKHEITRRLHPGSRERRAVALPFALNPPRGYFPDFLTPYESVGGFEAGLDAVLGTPKRRLRREIDQLAGASADTRPLIEGIGRGSPEDLDALGASLRRYHDLALAPVWDQVTEAIRRDRALRARQLVDGGLAAVLGRLHPQVRYADGVLEVGVYGRSTDRDVHLEGRGLLLIPSYFKETRQLMVLADAELPPVLVYPVDPTARITAEAAVWGTANAHRDAPSGPLTALMGRTRALVLEAVATGGTTSVLARRLGLTVPAASKHLAVLRNCGLVLSTRDRNTVHHDLTPLGRALLAAG